MTSERWEQITEIYHSALELEAAERRAFLDEQCADDESLRREVESLLLADAEAGDFIAEPIIKDIVPLLTMENETLPAGKLLGHYKILSKIGAGGMGEVYLAKDSRLDRSVAIKTLPASLSKHPNYLRRFETEAKAISALNHPNILTIYEIGECDDMRFLATEYVTGETLRERLRREPPTLRETLEIAAQIASALAAAHENGIIHRDIKPENIMLREDGFVKVLDFGLAKLIEKTIEFNEEATTLPQVNTAAGIILGTVAYMSPEQARSKTLDARTDVWSLGVCLYEMLAGRLPFEGETTNDRLAAILKTEPLFSNFASEIPPELVRIVGKTLRKDRDERYQTAKDLLIDLRDIKYELEFAAKTELLENNQTRGSNVKSETLRMAKADAQTGRASKISTLSGVERAFNAIKRRSLSAVSIAAVLMVMTIAFVYFISSSRFAGNDRDGINSVAVLPFANESGNADAEYLSDGISESLINSLSQVPQLKVIARSSSFKYKNKEFDLQEAARALGVEAILSGRVLQRGENLQISVELINASDKTQLWGEQYNRRAGDLLAVQSEISREIAGQLRARLTNAEQQQIAKRETTNREAYELVLKGRLYRLRGGAENRRKAIEYYQQAIAIDPAYALAHAELSEGYRSLINNRLSDPRELIFKSAQAAQRAVELDDRLAEAHYALATIKRYDWDWQASEREYKRALELNPNLASARNGYAVYLTMTNRHDEAIAEVRRARELDPLSLIINANVGYTLYFARRYDEAFEPLRKTLELEPNFPTAYSMLAANYAAKGMYREAAAHFQETIRLGGSNTGVQIYLGAVLARSGETEKARAILKQLDNTKEYVSPVELTVLYVALGEREQAFALLEKAYGEHDYQLQFLGADPFFDELRSDLRFQDLLRRVGLPTDSRN
jgi:serine/threonine-protein kinase